MHKTKLVIIALIICLAAALGWVLSRPQNQPVSTETQSAPEKSEKQTSTEPAIPAFDKQRYSLSAADSIWVVVNKQRPINPSHYVPPDLVLPSVSLRSPGSEYMKLRQPAALAVENMFADAKNKGVNLMVYSAYRSYDYQVTTYNSEVRAFGQTQADKESARPGYSEHQTGLSLDIIGTDGRCPTQTCFADTPEGKWLTLNAYRYGFVLRYPENKSEITGYTYEPWHYRFVGTELAATMHDESVLTLEEFFGLPAASSY